nr:hypothetical protein [Candidatus Sigynarchaeota archaeon]
MALTPSLFVDTAGNLHVVWVDYSDYDGSGPGPNIFYKRWNASSGAWTMTEVVSTESTNESLSLNPSLAVDIVGNVHVAWEGYAEFGSSADIFYKQWNATSGTWTTTEVVSSESTGSSLQPSISLDAVGNVHVVWVDYSDYDGSGLDPDIFYKQRNATSGTWTTTEVVSSESTDSSLQPSISLDVVGNVHVVWADLNVYDIFYKRWDIITGEWTAATVIKTEGIGVSSAPSLITDGTGNLHLIWKDTMNFDGSGGDGDIFYKKWDATSSTWMQSLLVSIGMTNECLMHSDMTDESMMHSFAVDRSGNAHVVWNDRTNNNGSGTDSDIFYKRLPEYGEKELVILLFNICIALAISLIVLIIIFILVRRRFSSRKTSLTS